MPTPVTDPAILEAIEAEFTLTVQSLDLPSRATSGRTSPRTLESQWRHGKAIVTKTCRRPYGFEGYLDRSWAGVVGVGLGAGILSWLLDTAWVKGRLTSHVAPFTFLMAAYAVLFLRGPLLPAMGPFAVLLISVALCKFVGVRQRHGAVPERDAMVPS
jgi:hypothetical protein